MGTLLAIATILGGVAALWFFWDKIIAWFHPHKTVELLHEDPVRWVDFNYPRDTGLKQRLESEGYQVAWSNDDKVSRKTELEGWEIVLEPYTNAIPTRIKLKTQPQDQTLIKKRIS